MLTETVVWHYELCISECKNAPRTMPAMLKPRLDGHCVQRLSDIGRVLGYLGIVLPLIGKGCELGRLSYLELDVNK